MGKTLFIDFSLLCEEIGKTAKRKEKIKILSDFLLKLDKEEIGPVLTFLLGKISAEKKLGIREGGIIRIIEKISGKRFSDFLAKTGDFGEAVKEIFYEINRDKIKPALTIKEVYEEFVRISEIKGDFSKEEKEKILTDILERANPLEAKYIVKSIIGEMRHGVKEGLLIESLSFILNIDKKEIERSFLISGDIKKVLFEGLTRGKDGIRNIEFKIFNPLFPMLAETANSIEEAISLHKGKVAIEYKLDGIRAQIHKEGEKVIIFSRNLENITDSFPEIVKEIKKIKVESIVVEGEIIGVDREGKPLPFQYLMRRAGRKRDITVSGIPVKIFLFDILFLNGKLLIDLPYCERRRLLEEIGREIQVVEKFEPERLEDAENYFEKAISLGHEGIMVKNISSPYIPGTRGKNWLKIKKINTLDLVIIGAEWGYGRRKNYLSDLYLGIMDDEKRKIMCVGKTFKGLSDEELKNLTGRLLSLKISQKGRTIFVKPEIVVEVIFDEIQKSPVYDSGFALRFARIKGIREDKGKQDINTISDLKNLYKKQSLLKGKYEEIQGSLL